MIGGAIKRADNFLQERCDKIPTAKRKGVVVAMFATLVFVTVINFITEFVI